MIKKEKASVKKYIWDFLDSNMYVFWEADHVLVIDPVDLEAVFERFVNAASVTVFLTHEHFDHICGLNKLRSLCRWRFDSKIKNSSESFCFNGNPGNLSPKNNAIDEIVQCKSESENEKAICRVIASEICSERIKDTKSNLSEYADVLAELSGRQIPKHWHPFSCEAADISFNRYKSFHWLHHSVELFYTPGHSYGSSCLLLDDMLFVGDTILENSLMVKFPGSSKKMYRNVTVPLLEQLLASGKVSFVYPGHGNVLSQVEALRLIKSV